MCAKGQSLIDRGHYASKEIRAKIKQLQNNWMKLRELLITRSERLKDAAQSLQVCTPLDELSSCTEQHKLTFLGEAVFSVAHTENNK